MRSSPYSKFSPQFNRETLSKVLRNHGVQYVFLGRELGARRQERDCHVGNQARYDLIVKSKLFREGLDRMVAGAASHAIALICAQRDPVTCYRIVLVCRELRASGLDLRHVLEDGSVDPNTEAENRLLDLADLPRIDLCRLRDARAEEVCDPQARRIAWPERERRWRPRCSCHAGPRSHGMNVFTIGFTKKPAKRFFELVCGSGANRVVDVCLNNIGQLAGFSKRDGLIFFLREPRHVDYVHVPELAPTADILDVHKRHGGAWPV